MQSFELKVMGRDRNTYYLDVMAPDEKLAKIVAKTKYPELLFSILDVIPKKQRTNLNENNFQSTQS